MGGGHRFQIPSDRGGHRFDTPSDGGDHRIHTPSDGGAHRFHTPSDRGGGHSSRPTPHHLLVAPLVIINDTFLMDIECGMMVGEKGDSASPEAEPVCHVVFHKLV